MSTPLATFTDHAAHEIDALHRLLQAWFRAEGSHDPAPILAHFDEGYSMLNPAGKLITYQQFREGLLGLRGTRPTLEQPRLHGAATQSRGPADAGMAASAGNLD